MRVCIQAQAAVESAGIGRYVRCLLEALVRLDGTDRFLPFRFDFRHRSSPFPADVEESVCRWLPGRVAQWSWRTLGFPEFDRIAPAADLYHFPNYLAPPLRRGRSVLTVHDAAFARFPETLEDRNLDHLRTRLGDSIARADAVIAVSEFTAAEFRDLFPGAAGKISAIPEGLPDDLAAPAPDRIRSVCARHGIRTPYLLTVGTVEPRKNHELLVDAFERLDEPELTLVIAGRDGWKCEPILRRFRESRCASRILRIERVPDADLPALYAGAELFLFPSRYEGFGFPPLEAMRCGTAVVAAANGSLPEILGDGAVLVPGDHADDWADAVRALLDSSGEREALAERGRERSRRYDWRTCALATRDLYRRVLDRPSG